MNVGTGQVQALVHTLETGAEAVFSGSMLHGYRLPQFATAAMRLTSPATPALLAEATTWRGAVGAFASAVRAEARGGATHQPATLEALRSQASELAQQGHGLLLRHGVVESDGFVAIRTLRSAHTNLFNAAEGAVDNPAAAHQAVSWANFDARAASRGAAGLVGELRRELR